MYHYRRKQLLEKRPYHPRYDMIPERVQIPVEQTLKHDLHNMKRDCLARYPTHGAGSDANSGAEVNL
jgi:hypothetical protein